jgi:fumarylacetoacetate (FAA) hydrolase family protein
MPIVTDAAFILPDDFTDAALMGRIWRPDLASPSVVAIRHDGVFDVTDDFPTASQLAGVANPARALRAVRGERVGVLQDLLNNTPPDNRDPTKPWLLAPIDLQVIKAAGVTFAVSMLERVIEERARGNPDSAAAIRTEVTRIVGTDLSRLKPGSAEAQHVKDVLVGQNAWSQYLEVGIGPDAEVFTKAPVLSAVGTCTDAGLHPKSVWNNPEPEVVLVVASDGRIVGASLGNDVNLRDFEGRSALLLSKAKDNNASCAIGPFVRFFDAGFGLDDVRTMEVSLEVKGPEGFVLHGASSLTQISRDPVDIVAQTINENHQYPDGFVLFLGTMFAPIQDRAAKGQGFTHVEGDLVTVATSKLGRLTNRMRPSGACEPWAFGLTALIAALTRRIQNKPK